MSKKKNRRKQPSTHLKSVAVVKQKVEAAQQAVQDPNQPAGAQPTLRDRIKACGDCGIIVTVLDPELSIFSSSVLRRIFNETKVKPTLYTTKPFNVSFPSLLKNLPYVNDVVELEKIDQDVFQELEKKHGVVAMINPMVAMQQGLARGLHASQAIAALMQIGMAPAESMALEIGLDLNHESLLPDVCKDGDYLIFAPGFLGLPPPQWTQPRSWSLQNWLIVADALHELGQKVVFVAANPNELYVPEAIEGIHTVGTDDVQLIAKLLKNAKGIVTIDNGYALMAIALKKKIFQIHSGGPLSWSAAVYPPFSEEDKNGLSRVVTAINVADITAEKVLDELIDFFGLTVPAEQ